MTDIFSVGLQKIEKSLMNESGIVARRAMVDQA